MKRQSTIRHGAGEIETFRGPKAAGRVDQLCRDLGNAVTRLTPTSLRYLAEVNTTHAVVEDGGKERRNISAGYVLTHLPALLALLSFSFLSIAPSLFAAGDIGRGAVVGAADALRQAQGLDLEFVKTAGKMLAWAGGRTGSTPASPWGISDFRFEISNRGTLADAIPSSAEDSALLGRAAAALIAIAVITAAVWQLFGKPSKERKDYDGKKTVTLKAELEFVPIEKFDAFEDYVHTQQHAIINDLNGLKLQMEDRRQESGQQMEDLREKLDEKFETAIMASNSSASKTHQRIDALAEKVGQLTGEIKHVAEAAREAARAAHAAAIAAAQSGGGRK